MHDSGAVRVTRCWSFDHILPHYKLFETQAQFIVVTEELRVRWDLIQEDLGHLQWALRQGQREDKRDKNKETELKGGRKRKQKQNGGRKERKCLRAFEQKE